MAEKQYTIVNMGLDGQYIKENGKIMTIEEVVELLNENEQLKSKNRGLQSELQIFKEDATHSNLQINKLADENEQLKQFQDRVFSWIDMHLQRLPTLRDDEFESDNEFADPSLYNGAIQILETMKKELKGDVE